MILKWILNKCVRRAWAGLIWLWLEINIRLCFKKGDENSFSIKWEILE
jgi:hypothetical protein